MKNVHSHNVYEYMNKQETIHTIQNLFTMWLTGADAHLTQENVSEIETILKIYLLEHPQDTDMWLRLALLYVFGWHKREPIESIRCLNNILSYDPDNIQAFLMLAFIESQSFGENRPYGQLRESTLALCRLQTNDSEVLSMIAYAKSFYYKKKDLVRYEQYLLKSIAYCDTHVNNLLVLGRYYLKKREFKKGKELIEKALRNIKGIYDVDIVYTDITDVSEFFNYYYKGIHRSIDGGFMIGNNHKIQEELSTLK